MTRILGINMLTSCHEVLMFRMLLQDRSNVLVVITPDNQQLLLAKRGGKFRVQLDPLHAMVLNGDAWRAL